MKEVKKVLLIILICIMSFSLDSKNVYAEGSNLYYSTYFESDGWSGFAGEKTTLESIWGDTKIEGLRVYLNSNIDGEIEYISYVQSYGWEDNWKKNGEISGNIYENKRLEAIKIRLLGNISNQYNIYYRVCSQDYGWLGWAKNGDTAGTIGLGKKIKSLEIKLLPIGENEETKNSYKNKKNYLTYSSHVQSYGWLSSKSTGMIGTTGKSKRLEAYKILLEHPLYPGNLEYSSYVEKSGWESIPKRQNKVSGTEGQSKKIEKIKMQLTGEIANYYDVYYRVHTQGFGWLGWAKNGEVAGTEGLDFRIEAMEIKLVEKGKGEATGNSLEKKDAFIYYSTISNNEVNEEKAEGIISGTTGKSLPINAYKMRIETELHGGVTYQSYNKNSSWEMNWHEDNDVSGFVDPIQEIQKIRIKLTGEISNRYDIYYRVHASKFGWLGWAKNGEAAGTNKYNIEAIEVRLYLKVDSKKNNLDRKDYEINVKQYVPYYYNQRDSRWRNNIYGLRSLGATGCTPTSLAMAYTGILNKSIIPPTVADYLYNNTKQYNKKYFGCSGLAIVYASNHYNVKYTPLKSKEEIKRALLKGNIVYGAMGPGKYGTKDWNHAIVFYSYDKDYTFVYDPLNRQNNDWVTISQLWREKSVDPDDSLGGAFFYSLEK